MRARVLPPDLASRPLRLTLERRMKAPPAAIYKAWTTEFDRWFAAPGTVLMTAAVDSPFFFETHFSDEKVRNQRHPHYGRFLELAPDKRVVMTWMTGPEGTRGAETVVTVRLNPAGNGTRLKLTQAGFPDEGSPRQHEDAWPGVLRHLDETLVAPARDQET